MKFYKILENTLKKEPNFFSDDGEIKKWVVINKAHNYDEQLIGLLLNDDDLKEKFFFEVKGITIFNQALFIQFLEQKNYLNNSYTAYKNKIGLTIDGQFLKQRNEVALVWPFKDCVLEGDQSREEDSREEIFFNNVLGQDEINQLLEPKVLTNAKRYTSEGVKPFIRFNRNEEGTITDNLVVRGNNLLVLHSLKREFAGKIKLIYIDPPYNTGNDGFKYNNQFNHSTWLTFMKNRLMVAQQLLKDDGLIFVSCDDNEQAYLKILMDEIFSRKNEIGVFVWRKKAGAGADSKKFFRQHEYILFYAKNNDAINKLYQPLTDKQQKEYKNPDNDHRGLWAPTDLTAPAHDNDPKRIYEIVSPSGNVFKRCWSYTEENMRNLLKDNLVYFGDKGDKMPKRKRFLKDKKGLVPRSWIDDYLTSDGKKDLNNIVTKNVFNYPKPVGLINRFVQIGTNRNDIVLDFFAGSGTTAQSVLELNKSDGYNRSFILIEQMDYVTGITIERVLNTIKKPGLNESFIYVELKKFNQTFINQIQKAIDTKALLQIWEDMKAKSFLNYNVDIKKQDEQIDGFKKLALEQQKEHLVNLLNKNQLYVNLSSIDDKDFKITNNEKKVSKLFYNI